MLNPQDLRIGNWVIKVSGTAKDSSSFFDYTSISAGEDLTTTARICFPIVLTSEILGKAGFRHDFGDWYKNQDFGDIYKTMEADDESSESYVLRFKKKDQNWYFDNKRLPAQPKYLHQLQNLVYALSHMEIKPQLGHFKNLPVLSQIDVGDQKGNLNKVPAYHAVFLKEALL